MSEFVVRESDNFRNLYWLDKYMMGHKGFIAGGCFKNIFNNEPVKDLDIFFENKEDYTKAVDYFKEHHDFEIKYQNKKVIAFKDVNSDIVLELISSVYGTPQEIINDFDFSITKFAYYKEIEIGIDDEEMLTYNIIHHKDFFEHLHMKRLVTNQNLKFPNNTFERLLRYAKYGYFPCRETKLNIISAIRINTNQDDTLSESLYDGVD